MEDVETSVWLQQEDNCVAVTGVPKTKGQNISIQCDQEGATMNQEIQVSHISVDLQSSERPDQFEAEEVSEPEIQEFFKLDRQIKDTEL